MDSPSRLLRKQEVDYLLSNMERYSHKELSRQLNERFKTVFWTPQKIQQLLLKARDFLYRSSKGDLQKLSLYYSEYYSDHDRKLNWNYCIERLLEEQFEL